MGSPKTKFPDVVGCLISDDFRSEEHNKGLAVGVLGLLPATLILLPEVGSALPQLAFTIFSEIIEAKIEYEFGFVITFPSGEKIGSEVGLKFTPLKANQYGRITMNFRNPVFTEYGVHKVNFFVDGESHWESSFRIEKPS